MFNLTQNMELSVLFIAVLLAIVMTGILILGLFKKIDKKQIFFMLFIYLLIFVRVGIDIYFLYFSRNIVNFVFGSNSLLIIPVLFFYNKRNKADSILLNIFSINTILVVFLGLLIQLITTIVFIYYIYLVLLAFYNILLYLLVLSFLIKNSYND